MVKRKTAFTFLELIVTIVVIGIAMTAIPMLLVQNNKALEQNLEQEALYAASTKLAQVLSYKWDEASTTNTAGVAQTQSHILDIPPSADTDTEFARIAGTRYRLGSFQLPGRRYMYSVETNASALGIDTNDLNISDDIDDPVSSSLIQADSQDGYKTDYNVTTTVSYIIDTNDYNQTTINNYELNQVTANRTNIKKVQIDVLKLLPSGGTQAIFRLSSFSCNIGESPIFSRVY